MLTAGVMAALVIAIAGLVRNALRHTEDRAGAAALLHRESAPVSDISWTEVNALYGRTPTAVPLPENAPPVGDSEAEIAADLRKVSRWSDYRGKTVEWEGTVVKVETEAGGGQHMRIRMNDATPAGKADIFLALRDSERSKGKRLKGGDRVRFRGRLKNWSSVVPIVMDDGELPD